MQNMLSAINHVITSLDATFLGPGGVVGVVKDGEIIAKRAWGYADPQRRLAMTEQTLMPICSITKQFTCGLLLELVSDPTSLDDQLAHLLPMVDGERPRVIHLCNNQSGIRDYWALTVLQGANAEDPFERENAGTLFARTQTTHFKPGSKYSYSNSNFRMLSDLIERCADRPFSEILNQRIFSPAGMASATMASDTAAALNGVVGHEGNAEIGFLPVINRIYWSGDGGIAATLEDMLAWEIFIDRARDDPDSLYKRLSKPQFFSDGRPSQYALGLGRERIDGVEVTGHGGAIRGFRCRRLHVASQRLSVVVMFNHEADAYGAAVAIIRAAMGATESDLQSHHFISAWSGQYLEPESGLVLEVEAQPVGLNARFGVTVEKLDIVDPQTAKSKTMTLVFDQDLIHIERPGENLRGVARRTTGDAADDVEGRFYCEEIGSWLTLVCAGGATHGCFDGPLGQGTMYPVKLIGRDVGLLSCRRAMDAPPPGDWTIQFQRSESGKVCGLVIGCWLARNVVYRKMG